jgi:hypothetical protein
VGTCLRDPQTQSFPVLLEPLSKFLAQKLRTRHVLRDGRIYLLVDYLLTDRGRRLAGIAILAGRLESLPSANVTAVGLGSGIGTSATG